MIRVFVADDDQEDIGIFKTALKAVPIDTDLHVVSNGATLLQHIGDDSIPNPDFLFLDLRMPGQTGFECLNYLRQNPAHDHIRIIILSDSVNVGEIDDAYDLGADYFLTKPSELEEFRSILHHILCNAKAKAPSREAFHLRNNYFTRLQENDI